MVEEQQPNSPETNIDETATSEAASNSFSETAELIEKLTKERDDLHDQVLRTVADFQNFKRRSQQEKDLFRQLATQNLLEQLLPVLDNFERTVRAANSGATLESVLNGIGMVEKQLRGTLESHGMKRIPSVGTTFDANLHEAIATVPTADHEPDTIVDEIEAGYLLAEKVIRPAKVRVSVAP